MTHSKPSWIFYHSQAPDMDWSGGFQNHFKKKDFVAVIIASLRMLKSILLYQKSLSSLVADVKLGNEKVLFDVVRIDRTVMAVTVKWSDSLLKLVTGTRLCKNDLKPRALNF